MTDGIQNKRRLEDFGDLSEAEAQLCRDIRTKSEVVLGDGLRPEAGFNERSVRAELVEFLIKNYADFGVRQSRIFKLSGALISSKIDLSRLDIQIEISLTNCFMKSHINIKGSSFSGFDLSGSRFSGLNGQGALIDGDLQLTECRCFGSIDLQDAGIKGTLNFYAGHFLPTVKDDDPGYALYADGVNANRISMRKAIFYGEVMMKYAKIIIGIYCDYAEFRNWNIAEKFIPVGYAQTELKPNQLILLE